jgi:hypothetical protein
MVITDRAVVQNRELQIMRLVSHPNVVDLKAFFYSNGDKVCAAWSNHVNSPMDICPKF